MAKGGKRLGAGRKKIGVIINLRVQEDLLDEIDRCISGKTKAEKIRKCLLKGLEKEIGDRKI